MALLPKMHSKRGVAVLEAIFSDREVLSAMGAGKQFNDATGKVPLEVLKKLKAGLGGHIKKNAFAYHQVINREVARIGRIKQLQVRAVGLVGSGFVAALIGLANFVSNAVYDAVYWCAVY